MTDEPDLEIEIARFEQQRATVEQALEACGAEQAIGRTGYAAYMTAKAEQEKLLAMATVLQRRITRALESL